MAINWNLFDEKADLETALASAIEQRLRGALVDRGMALMAVSGGSTPKGLFNRLSLLDLDWASVTVTLVDERCVPSYHADSNERLVRDHLLKNRAQTAQLLPMYDAVVVDAAARQHEEQLRLLLPFTAVVLGMGGDGHTASWFPDSDQLASVTNPENERDTVAISTPSSPHQRLTLTLPAVLNCTNLILHITGAEKRRVLEENVNGMKQDPISRIIHHPGVSIDVYWAP